MNVALIGPTCAGKTTCASRVCEPYQLRHLSTGQVLRENRAQQTALGILTRKYVEMGELAPDEIINAMIEEAVRKLPLEQGLLLDGFPSSLYQARFLDELFRATHRWLDGVILLNIPAPVVFDRSSKRTPQRPDDRPEILRHRLQVFRRTTGPVIDYYRQSNRLGFLDATGSIEAVSANLASIFDRIRSVGSAPALTPEQNQVLDELLTKPALRKVAAPQSSLDLVIMGAPGSGKGTRAAFLAEQLGLPHIASGDLFRENRNSDTILGKIAQTYIERGELVPDDVTEAMLRERLSRSDATDGFILDGFPRTLPQAQALSESLTEMNRKLNRVIYLKVPDEEIVQRISGRRLCPVCQASYHLEFNPPKTPGICDRDGSALFQRDDDNPATVRARLKIFHGETMPVIDHYRKTGLLIEVSPSNDMAQTRQQMLELVENIQKK